MAVADKLIEQPRHCTISTSRSRRLPSCPPHVRDYHATQLLRQQRPQDEKSQETSGTPREAGEADTKEGRLRDAVRTLMRDVPSSVAVVTVASHDAELNEPVPMGVAVSSLSTLSLDPPTVSFNIKHPSKTLEAIKQANGLFRVHFPVADRGGAAMVDLFCRGNHSDAYAARRRGLKLFVPGSEPRAEERRPSASNAPQIFGDSLRAAMECTLTHGFEIGDHFILVASVNNVESQTPGHNTILYVDGMYMRPDGAVLTPHVRGFVAAYEGWSAYDYPLFPGNAERLDYTNRIKAIVKKHPSSQQGRPSRDFFQELGPSLRCPPTTLGISLEKVMDDVRQESGESSELEPHWEHLSPVSDFYGRLTPSDRAKIYERVRNLVKEDASFLSLNYRTLLQHAGISTSSINLLPSDILTFLRDAGLVGPFQPRQRGSSPDKRDITIQYLEQFEHNVTKHLATLSYDGALKLRLDALALALGEPAAVASYLNRARTRLITESLPQFFSSEEVDISGHVSQKEARVVMGRILQFLNYGSGRKNIQRDIFEMLRRNRIHPSITGLDVEFFIGKIRDINSTTRHSHDASYRVTEMLTPYFATTITWADLEARVKDFVQETPMRAMSWNNRDVLSAMGLDAKTATLQVPISENNQLLRESRVIGTLVAKELKSLYNKSTSDLDQAIARHLKEQYGFDVTAGSSQALSAADDQTRSSYDEVREAMLESQNVAVQRFRYSGPRKLKADTKPLEKKGERTWTTYSINKPASSRSDEKNTKDSAYAGSPRIRFTSPHKSVSDIELLEEKGFG